MSTTKRIAKRMLAVILTVMMLMSMVTIGMTSASAAKVDLAETGATLNASGNGRLYFNMSAVSWWNTSSAGGGNYVYFFNNSTGKNAWSAKAQVYSGSVYYVNIPAGDWAGVILTRNSVTSGPTWNNKWNQTGDITMSNTSNYISKFADNSTSVTWGTQKPASTATLTSSAATIELGATANLTAALSSNTNLNTVKSVAYSVSPAGATVDGNTFTATEAGTYTVTATVTYNPYDYAGITSTTTATTTITVEAPVVEETTTTAPATSSSAAEEESSSETVEETETTVTVPATSDPVEEKNTIDIDWAEDDGLYAYANITDEPNTEAWQRWVDVSGTRRFYLPASASDTEVLIYSTYTSDVTINGVTIAPGEYAKVPYTEGTTYTCSGATDQSFKIYKTDAEASLFINAADGMTAKYDNTDSKVDKDASFDIMAFFRSGSKNQEIGKAGGAVADANGVVAEQVKKLKGRGNTTWSEDKKPFNVTFKNEISIDGMDSFDKWSLLANAKDDSLLRNRLVYDMANEVNMEYACDSRFVDLFISGRYEGSYQLVQKIEMNEGSVMSNLNEVEVDPAEAEYKADNFDFVLELDTAANAANAGDLTFPTDRKQIMTHKIPDEPTAEQVAFMKAKYQAVEDALYGDDLATLEKLVDMNDLAKAYLINEISKNIDSGVTSCYFTYSADDGKFYLSPVWDFDNAVGNLASGRKDLNGNSLSLTKTSGWYAKEMAHFDENFTGKRSVFSMACYTTTKTAAGDTFNDIVKRVWDAEFADLIDILEGTKTGDGRLDSLDGYAESLTKSAKWNFEKGWTLKQDWTASRSSLTMYDFDAETNTLTSTTNNYSESSVTDMRRYAVDWTISRLNWLAAQFADVDTEEEETNGYITIYFENNWKWPDASVHIWGSSLQADTTWPGTKLTKIDGQNKDGFDIYELQIPADATGILFNGTGEYGFEQSADINGGWYEGICYYMTYDSATNTKPCGTYDHKVPVETTTAEVTTTSTPAESDPIETTTSTPATADEEVTTTEGDITMPVVTTKTVFFQNNWKWTDVRAYVWTEAGGFMTAWPGEPMAKVGNDGTYDIYAITIPADANVIFNGIKDDGSGAIDQTPDITDSVDGNCYYNMWDNGNKVEFKPIEVILPELFETTAPATTTTPATADEEETDPTETTTSTPVEATKDEEVTTTPVETTTEGEITMPVVTTKTVFFQNNWLWTDVRAYVWTEAGGFMTAWPGEPMSKVGNDGTYDIYAITIPGDANIIFNGIKDDGSGNRNQSPDINDPIDGMCYYMMWDNGNLVEYVTIEEILPELFETTAPVTTSTPATPDEEETTAPATTTPVVVDTTVKLAGTFTDWADGAIEMTADGDVYTTTLRLEADTYEFKMIKFGEWLGNAGTIENTCEGWRFRNVDADGITVKNCTLIATGGEYTFTFDTTTDKLTVTAVLDPLPTPEYVITWPEGNGNFELSLPATADEGELVEFTATAAEGWIVAGVIIQTYDAEGNLQVYELVTDENGLYSFTVTADAYLFAVIIQSDFVIPEETTTPEETTEPTEETVEYNVTVNAKNATVTAPETVVAGDTLTFTVEPTDDYVIDYVFVNGVEYEANDANEYVVADVNENISIVVIATEENSNDTPIVVPTQAPTTEEPTTTEAPTTEEPTTTVPATEAKKTYVVMFVDHDNTLLSVQTVVEGESAVAPADPTRTGYTFTGWKGEYTNVTDNVLVVAQYKKNEVAPPAPATTGRLQVEVSGGTGVTINGRPQGTSYLNTKMAIGASVTIEAKATSGATFVGWLNASNNLIITTDTTYTFTATGNDSYKALYLNDVDGVNAVRFMNDKSKQILDMQYYAAGEEIVYPAYPTQAGFKATGWNMTDAKIQAQLAAGNDVTVSPTWERVQVYVNVSATGGTLSNGNGSYLLTGHVTATANAPEAGKKFAYWVDQNNDIKSYDAEYSFFAVKDTELTAVYVAEDEAIEYKILVNVDAIDTVTYDSTNATYYSWYVPTAEMGITYVKNGVISVNKNNYKEATFVAGTTDKNVYDRGPSGTEAVPVGSRSWTKSNVLPGDTWMSRAYVQYTINGDPSGTVYTVYSDIVEATRY